MPDDFYLHHAMKAAYEVALENMLKLVAGARNAAMAPSHKKHLTKALQELMAYSPNFGVVDEAIKNAEAHGFKGEELSRAKVWAEKVRTGTTGKIAKKKTLRKAKTKRRVTTTKKKSAPRVQKRGATSSKARAPGGKLGGRR